MGIGRAGHDTGAAGGEGGAERLDYRFSLANERTFLAWVRTALALLAGGVAAAKALDFEHSLWRWAVAGPPIVLGALLAARAAVQLRRYEAAMQQGRSLPGRRGLALLAGALAAYGALVLLAVTLDGS